MYLDVPWIEKWSCLDFLGNHIIDVDFSEKIE
jgi:hypothetical protein